MSVSSFSSRAASGIAATAGASARNFVAITTKLSNDSFSLFLISVSVIFVPSFFTTRQKCRRVVENRPTIKDHPPVYSGWSLLSGRYRFFQNC